MLVMKDVTGGYHTKNNSPQGSLANRQENDSILININLNIADSEAVAIIGKNGSGKSTLAKSIMNMIPVRTGDILFNGINLNPLETHEIVNTGIGYLAQDGRIFSHLSIEENLRIVCSRLKNGEYLQRKDRIMSYSTLFEKYLNAKMKIQASNLSGGEKHQLALAMVLLQNPKLLILDEPSAGLDKVNSTLLYKTLHEIRKNTKISFLLIEHNHESAFSFGDKVFSLENKKLNVRNNPK